MLDFTIKILTKNFKFRTFSLLLRQEFPTLSPHSLIYIHNLRTIIDTAERSRYNDQDMDRTAVELCFNSRLKLESFLYFVVCREALSIQRLFFSHSVDRASWYICVIKTNKMHFSFLIYFNNLSCTCFEHLNNSSSGCSYSICSMWYLTSIYFK